jgi:indole-3-glycerol phosphate synthase
MTILDEIFAHKRQEVALASQHTPLAELAARAAQALPALDFIGALRTAAGTPGSSQQADNSGARGGVALIAEIKAASPSKGNLVESFEPLRQADLYAENGAAAISVLTDERFFKGHLDYLRQVRSRHPSMPLLRKDFIYDPYQIFEARAAGADAILLIAAMLDSTSLGELQDLAAQLGMAALVEVHTEEELQAVLPLQPRLVGINNRDLHTFRVSLGVSLALRPLIPADVTVVAESGINNAEDVQRLGQAGVQAVLVGEALMTAQDIAQKVRELAVRSVLPDARRSRRNLCEG